MGQGVSSVDHHDGLNLICWCSPGQQRRQTYFAESALVALVFTPPNTSRGKDVVPFVPFMYGFLSLLHPFKKFRSRTTNVDLGKEFEGQPTLPFHSTNSLSLRMQTTTKAILKAKERLNYHPY